MRDFKANFEASGQEIVDEIIKVMEEANKHHLELDNEITFNENFFCCEEGKYVVGEEHKIKFVDIKQYGNNIYSLNLSGGEMNIINDDSDKREILYTDTIYYWLMNPYDLFRLYQEVYNTIHDEEYIHISDINIAFDICYSKKCESEVHNEAIPFGMKVYVMGNGINYNGHDEPFGIGVIGCYNPKALENFGWGATDDEFEGLKNLKVGEKLDSEHYGNGAWVVRLA